VRISKTVSIAVLAVGVLLAAGCSGDDKKKEAQAQASASAVAASSAAAVATTDLRAAVGELTKTSYKYTMKAGDASGQGSIDPAAAQRGMTVSISAEGPPFKTELLSLGPELFARISGLPVPGIDGKKWMRIDRSKIKSFGALGIRDIDDPTGVTTLSQTIVTIQKTGDRAYKGTLDLSKGSAAFGLDEAAVRQLAEQAKSVPFEATVNDKSKLASWKMTIPAHGSEKEITFELAYTEHGGSFPLTKPAAGETANPPQTMYDMLQT
jgi:hypothetical protein